MADICYGVLSEGYKSLCESSSRAARRRRIEIRRIKFGAGFPPSDSESEPKRQKLEVCCGALANDGEGPVEICVLNNGIPGEVREIKRKENTEVSCSRKTSAVEVPMICQSALQVISSKVSDEFPKFGTASVCGRRRDMEDAVAVHPSFFRRDLDTTSSSFHYFAVYDGHGCSHVSTWCRERLHVLVKEELEKTEPPAIDWKSFMERSFRRMDNEVEASNITVTGQKCRCELQSPECDAVGSTAVVSILTSDKIIVANCGDSRAVLCRNGHAIPLSSDHKPDRPDELSRICAAGGRVIYWDGPRVLGVLAMSRAIGDNYLKPYVSCEPEVTSTDRTAEDECLILASDGLWDVVSNETACGVALMCLRGKAKGMLRGRDTCDSGGEMSDDACTEASMLLTKLALARRSSDNVSVVVVDLRRNTWAMN